jgi:adenylate cyclase
MSDGSGNGDSDRSTVAAVGRVLAAISGSAFDLEPVLSQLAAEAQGLCRAEMAFVFLRDGDVFRFAAASGGTPEHWEYERQHPDPIDRRSVVGRVALSGQPVHVADLAADPEYQAGGYRVGGVRSMFGVPIRTEEGIIGAFGLGRTRVEPFSDEQIQIVSVFADQAGVAIRIARLLSTIERQRTELARFAPQAAGLLTSPEGEQLLAGHRREISAMFCDLRGFTAFAETAEPEELLNVLRAYHAAVGELSVAAGGTVEHFAGDGLMVFFNDPARVADHQLVAVHTACAVRDRLAELAGSWQKRGYDLGLGIGIASGYATLGRIGFEGRYDYGAMGIVVNLASRLSSAADAGEILISQRHYAAVEDRVSAAEHPPVSLKGFARPVPVWAVESVKPGD